MIKFEKLLIMSKIYKSRRLKDSKGQKKSILQGGLLNQVNEMIKLY